MAGAVPSYPAGRGVAVLFYLPDESRFRKVALPLEQELRACGYDTHCLPAGENMLDDARRIFASARGAASLLLSYNGHGAMHCGQQLLWTEGGNVRVDELEDLMNKSVALGTPKLIITDCCYGNVEAGPGVPPVWTWPSGDENTVHDMAVFHATCPGHYSHSNAQSSLTVFMARAMAAHPEGISLDAIKYAIAGDMRRMDHGVMEPTLDNRLSQPLVFARAAEPGRQATPAPPAPAAFPVRHKATGMVLDVHGGSASAGAALELFPLHGGENQQFIFEAMEGEEGYGALRSAESGKAADVEGDSRAPGARVFMFPFNPEGQGNQLFRFEPAKGKRGYGLLRGQASGLVLAAAEGAAAGAALMLAEETGEDNQLFHIGH